MRKWNLALMSYKEIAAIPKERSVLLMPVGCVEQHGPAGYTGADTVLAEYLCRRVAEAGDEAYVTPPLWFGYTPYTAFSGTVSLRLETLQAVVQDVVDGYINHGFRHIVIVNNHGPNEAAIEPVAAGVRQRHGIVLSLLYPWRLAVHVAEALFPDARSTFGHGGEPTISVMMALSPGTVDLRHVEEQVLGLRQAVHADFLRVQHCDGACALDAERWQARAGDFHPLDALSDLLLRIGELRHDRECNLGSYDCGLLGENDGRLLVLSHFLSHAVSGVRKDPSVDRR